MKDDLVNKFGDLVNDLVNDTISRAAALTALGEEPPVWYDGEDEIAERDQWRRDVAAIKALPSAQLAQDLPKGCTDTISRQAAVDLVEEVENKRLKGEIDLTYAPMIKGIKALPSTQPEIIHCKDCKYNPNPPECGNAACVLFYGMTDQMGFCHHGERRERE